MILFDQIERGAFSDAREFQYAFSSTETSLYIDLIVHTNSFLKF